MNNSPQKTGWEPDKSDPQDYAIDHSKIIGIFERALTKLLSAVKDLITILPSDLQTILKTELQKGLNTQDPIQAIEQAIERLLLQQVMLLPTVLVTFEAVNVEETASCDILSPAPIEPLLKIREKAASEAEKIYFDQNSLEVMRSIAPGITLLSKPLRTTLFSDPRLLSGSSFKFTEICQAAQSYQQDREANQTILEIASIDEREKHENFIFLPVRGSILDTDRVILPPAVDLSYYCSEIKFQKEFDTCCAHAGVALLEFFHNKKRLARKPEGEKVDLSRRFLHTVSRMVGQKQDDQPGSSIRATMKAMKIFGIPPESFWQYGDSSASFQERPDAFCYTYAQNYQVVNYFRLDKQLAELENSESYEKEQLNQLRYQLLVQVKAFLAAGFPSMFGVHFPIGGFQTDKTGLITYQPNDEPASQKLGHAVIAVGYDDLHQAILIRNSWEHWGIQGYAWLPYQFILEGETADWWSIIDAEWFDEGEFGLRSKANINLGGEFPFPT